MTTTTPIKYKRDYDPDELIQVTLSQQMVGGENRKRKVPKAKEDSIESVLQVMIEFDEVSKPEVLDFDGNDLYNNFRSVLPASLRDDWDETVRRLGIGVPAQTAATFRNCQRQWMTSFISEGAAEDLKEYIETILRKERDDTIHHLVTRSKTLRKRHFQLLAGCQDVEPAAAQMMTDRELVRAMYRGLPQKWKDNFLLKYTLQNCNIMQFQTFMTQQKAAHDRQEAASKAQKNKRSTTNNEQKQSRKRSNTGQYSNKNRNKCRKHPHLDHDWIDCFDNPKGRNYRPRDANGRYLHPNSNNHSNRYTQRQHGTDTRQNQNHYYGRQTYYQNTTPSGIPPEPVGDGRTQGGMPIPQHSTAAYYHGASMTREVEPSSSHKQPLHQQYTNQSCAPINLLQEDHSIIQHSIQARTGHEDKRNRLNNQLDIQQNQYEQEGDSFATQTPIPLTRTENDIGPHLSPATIMHAYLIQGTTFEVPLRVLLDPGSDGSHFHERCIPKGIKPKLVPNQTGITIAGTSHSNRQITLEEITFPEFNKHHSVQEHTFQVFDAPSFYDVILGKDILFKIGAAVDLNKGTMTAFDYTIPMRVKERLENRNHSFYDCFTDADTWFFERSTEYHSVQGTTKILASKYEKVDIEDVIQQQHHLDNEDKASLRRVLEQHSKLFDGQIGRYPHKKMDLTLIEGAQPVHLKPYSVPRIHYEVFRNELKRLCEIGVLSRVGSTEWAFPSFIIPKKDGRVRWISDFRKLNALIKRKQYPLPRIQDILRKRPGYRYFTKIDISMQYYTFELTEAAKDLCVIITPFGKFRYNVAPMGVKQSPDFAQEIMETVLRKEQEDIEIYLDDIGIWGKSREHIEQVEKRVLTRLEDNGFTVNPLKCEWRVQETDWLGHWLTPKGLKPWKKKVQAILSLQRPTSVKDVRSFIGAVNFYRDLLPHRSHVLAPLCELPTKGSFEWQPIHDKAFAAMKAIMLRDCLVHYPDHNLPFDIYTDASDYQLGAVILQNGRPVAYYSRKLTGAQRNYATMGKELLSIYETLKEFNSMLMGATITIYTDHMNLTVGPSTNQRILRQLMYIEEFQPTFRHIAGLDNVLADMFSRLPLRTDLALPDGLFQEEKSTALSELIMTVPSKHVLFQERFDHLNYAEIKQCYMNFPDPTELPPIILDYARLAQEQERDAELQQRRWAHPTHYPDREINRVRLTAFQPNPNEPYRFCIPTQVLQSVVEWYHEALFHCGAGRLTATIGKHFHHPRLNRMAMDVCEYCDACQRNNLIRKQYGHLPARIAQAMPWQEVHIDLIGPWKVKFQGESYSFYALTCIDPATGFPEAERISNKTAMHVGLKFENIWCSRYPRPTVCVHDPGPEFKGDDFQSVLRRLHITDKTTTVRNPQANAVCERLHQTMEKTIRILIHQRPPQNIVNVAELVDTALASSLHSVRATIHATLGISPGAIVYNRDMIHDIPVHPDFTTLQAKRQAVIDTNLARANAKRVDHRYRINDLVLQIQHSPDKLDERATGPYRVIEVFQNGMLRVDRGNGIHANLNSRWFKPYKQR